jgi:DNA invertase Pin-like site-specific DNA recombinase
MLDNLALTRCDVTRLDRLARSTRDLLAIVKQIVDADATFIRTRTAEGRSRPQKLGRLMIAVLGGQWRE